MQVYINRGPVQGPWGGGAKFFNAYWEFTGEHDPLTLAVSQGFPAGSRGDIELCDDPSMNINPDVMLIVGLDNQGPTQISIDQAVMYQLYVKPTCKIVLRVNECDARKGTTGMDEMLLKVSEHVDGTVFVSNWLKDYFNEKGWACKEQTVIYNGVQRSIFKQQPKLNNGKLNIVAHHWSDNRMKGADVYEKIDELVGEQPDKFAFTYVGRHQCDFKNTKVIRPLHGHALGAELGKHDVYVSGSLFDPGPNHILESLACELPTYVHRDGGGAVEFAGCDSTYVSWTDLKNRLEHHLHPTGVPAIHLRSWKESVAEYNDFLKSIVNLPA